MADEGDKANAGAGELDLEFAGQKVRTKGYRLADLIWLPLVLGVAYISLTLYNHEATAQQERQAIAGTLKESNTAIAISLEKSNAATVRALEAVVVEMKKNTSASKETACLLDPVMKNRADAREFCKRMVRDDR